MTVQSSTSNETSKRVKHPTKRKDRFAVRALPVVLGTRSTKKRPGDHVVGRPFTNYLSLPPGDVKVDTVADRLGLLGMIDDGLLNRVGRINKIRNAVYSAHLAGIGKIIEFNSRDPASRAKAGLRALRAVHKLVDDPSFIPAIGSITSIVATKNSRYSEYVHELVRALDRVVLLEAVLADAARTLKPVEARNPGRPYMAGFAESTVTFWRELTGEFPAKTRKSAKRSRSHRVLFWDFADRALADLLLQDQPIDRHVRSAIDRLKRGDTPPPK